MPKKTKKVEMEYETFPQVWKNPQGFVTIVYRNRTETYKLVSTYNNTAAKRAGNPEFNPYSEIEMEKGNGGRKVHCSKTVRVISYTKGGDS